MYSYISIYLFICIFTQLYIFIYLLICILNNLYLWICRSKHLWYRNSFVDHPKDALCGGAKNLVDPVSRRFESIAKPTMVAGLEMVAEPTGYRNANMVRHNSQHI